MARREKRPESDPAARNPLRLKYVMLAILSGLGGPDQRGSRSLPPPVSTACLKPCMHTLHLVDSKWATR